MRNNTLQNYSEYLLASTEKKSQYVQDYNDNSQLHFQ